MSTVAVKAIILPKAPYRGLRPYRYADQAIFFAREAEKRALFRKAVMYRGVLLYGDQGSGKSSLINAGLMPLAIDEGFAPERIRIQPKVGAEIVVERVLTSDDSDAPFLPSLFASEASGPNQLAFSVEAFGQRLAEIEANATPLLIFDQFEEFVTLPEEALRAGRSDEPLKARQRILDFVVGLLRARDSSIHVVFVFREDYLARLNQLFVLCPELTNQYVYLTPPPASSLPEIVRGPFESDRLPKNHFDHELPGDLCSEIVTALERKSDGGKINLAEVQIVALRLWNVANPEREFERRGVSGLLEDFLSDALATIDARLQPAALALLARLVTRSGTRNVVSEEDLMSMARQDRRLPEDLFREALDKLQDTGLLRRERRNQSYTYEIVSEFLVPWIHRYRLQSQAEIDRRKWVRRFVVFGLIIAVIGAAVSYWIINQNSERAIRTRLVQEADDARKEAELERNQSNQLSRQYKQLLNGNVSVDSRLKEAADNLSKLSADRDQWQKQAVAAQQEAKRQMSLAQDTLKQKNDDAAATTAQLAEANKKAAGFEQQATALSTQVNDLKNQLEIAKKSPQPSGTNNSQQPNTASVATLVDAVWTVIADKTAKEMYGEKVAKEYYAIQYGIANRTRETVAVRLEPLAIGANGVGIAIAIPTAFASEPRLGSFTFVVDPMTTQMSVFFILKSQTSDPSSITPQFKAGVTSLRPLPESPRGTKQTLLPPSSLGVSVK